MNDADASLRRTDALESSAWFVSDGEGTTSALFVVSNSIADDRGGQVVFVASSRRPPICDLDRGGGDEESENERVYITRQGRCDCAVGFRLGLDVDPSGTIRAVGLDVRAP